MKEITFIAAFWVSLAIVACIGRMIIKKKSHTKKDGTSITVDEPESSTGCDDKEISENNKLMIDAELLDQGALDDFGMIDKK